MGIAARAWVTSTSVGAVANSLIAGSRPMIAHTPPKPATAMAMPMGTCSRIMPSIPRMPTMAMIIGSTVGSPR